MTTPTTPPEPDLDDALDLADDSTASGQLPSNNTVRRALESRGVAPDSTVHVLWLLEYARREGHHSRAKVGALIGRDASVISKLFRGIYPATSLPSIIALIVKFRANSTQVLMRDGSPLVDLRITREVGDFLDLARKARTMALLFGKNQSGKSTAVLRYSTSRLKAPSGGLSRVFLITMPPGGGTNRFFQNAAKGCGIPHRKCAEEINGRLLDLFTPDDLVIVDEMHQTLIGRTVKTTTIEHVRAFHDQCGCTVAMVSTDVLPEKMSDAGLKEFLGQIDNRAGVMRLKLPSQPYKQDVATMAQAYGLPFPEKKWMRDELEKQMPFGLGRICKQFQMAKIFADAQRVEPNWDHYRLVIASSENWGKGDSGEDDWGKAAE
jgi:hypothetical protein